MTKYYINYCTIHNANFPYLHFRLFEQNTKTKIVIFYNLRFDTFISVAALFVFFPYEPFYNRGWVAIGRVAPKSSVLSFLNS